MSTSRFALADAPLDTGALHARLRRADAGACLVFEGWVRDHHAGRAVGGLHYDAHAALAQTEGAAVLEEAMARFALVEAICVHRVGTLAIGELAVWVGVSAAHRDAAYAASRFVIDTIKDRVPIWKNERYVDGAARWIHPDAG